MATRRKARQMVSCQQCGARCEERRAPRKFCSAKCGSAAWQAARKNRDSRLRELVKALAKEAGFTPADFA